MPDVVDADVDVNLNIRRSTAQSDLFLARHQAFSWQICGL